LYAKNIAVYTNIASDDGSVYCFDAADMPIMLIFEDTRIYDNQALQDGGGIYNSGSIPLFLNALIYDNNGGNVATIYNAPFSTIAFVHATMTKVNVPMSSVEIAVGGNFYAENCIICLNGFTPPAGNNNYTGNCSNIFINPANYDFTLHHALPTIATANVYNIIQSMLSEIPHSTLCGLPSGLLDTDIAGNPRITNGISSYGAYETNNPPIVPPYPPHWKSIGNNPKQEEILTKDGSDWKLKTYPNPTSSEQQITISLENGNLLYDGQIYLKLFSIDGSLLFDKTFSTGQFTTDIPQLAAGIYIIRLQTETGQTYTGKLVVK
jgi:hypothetical protein